MPHIRKISPPVTGEGALSFPGHDVIVRYSLAGPASKLRQGPARLRGDFATEPAIAEAAFRHGEGVLKLEDGTRYRLTMLGHSLGSGVTAFEMRI